ncbi:MAG TPA: type 4a pilus biogenesis protein PilO [Cellulomonas sp.]
MRLSARRLWMIGAALAAAVLLLLGWMLLISPQLDNAEASRTEAQETADANDLLRLRIVALADDYANLSTLQAELETLRGQFPTGLELPEFVRRISALASESGATVQNVTRSEPTVREDVATVWEVPVSLTVAGTHDQVLAYVERLQGVDDRLFLVSGFSLTADADDGCTSSITGYTFVLPEDSTTATADSDDSAGTTSGADG